MNNNYKQGSKVPNQNLEQMNYVEQAKAKKKLQVLCIPDAIWDANDAFAAARLVRKGSLLRVLGSTGEFLRFASTAALATVPAVGTTTAIQTPNEWFFVVATEAFVRTSAAMRIEVIYENE